MLVDSDRFLTELMRLFEATKEKGTVFLTTKRSASRRRPPVPDPGPGPRPWPPTTRRGRAGPGQGAAPRETARLTGPVGAGPPSVQATCGTSGARRTRGGSTSA